MEAEERTEQEEAKAEKEVKKGPRRDPAKEAFWRQRIGEAEASGLSVREFCKDYGLNENQFYAWRRELKLRDVERKTGSGFVELVRAADITGTSGVSLRVDDRLSIVVDRGFDVQTLKAVLLAVGQAGTK